MRKVKQKSPNSGKPKEVITGGAFSLAALIWYAGGLSEKELSKAKRPGSVNTGQVRIGRA